MNVENVTVPVQGLEKPMRIALAADLHNRSCNAVLETLRRDPPDVVAAVGDILEHYSSESSVEGMISRNQNAVHFLREAGKLAPLFYTFGNHELYISEAARKAAQRTSVVLLNDKAVEWNGLLVGGLASNGRGETYLTTAQPNTAWLNNFAAQPGPKLLLSHHPEFFPPVYPGHQCGCGAFRPRPRWAMAHFRAECVCAGAGAVPKIHQRVV